MSSVLPRRDSKLRRAKRDALIDTAVGVIAEKGYQACTFRALAEVAGTSTAPFTYEFGSRLEMMEAVISKSYEKAWPTVDGPADGEDPVEALYMGFVGMVRLDDPEAMRFARALYEIYLHSPREPELLRTIKEIEDAIYPGYVELVEAAQRAGSIPLDRDPGTVVDEIWAALDGINIARFSYPERFPQDRAESMFRDMFERVIA